MAKIIEHVKQANPKVVEVLQRDSEVLARIQDSFHAMIITQNKEGNKNGFPPIEITCFYEELPLPGLGLVRLKIFLKSGLTLNVIIRSSLSIRPFFLAISRLGSTQTI